MAYNQLKKNYLTEFYTPPYDFLVRDSSYQGAPRLGPKMQVTGGLEGVGCCSSCASGGSSCGGHKGVGLFDGGVTEWGLAEAAVVGVAAYAVFSMFVTTVTAKRYAQQYVGKDARRSRRRASLKRKLEALED